MNLLVTGGAGFIGCHVLRHVIAQPSVRLVVNLDALTYAGHVENLEGLNGQERYRFERVDLRDKLEVLRVIEGYGITHILHLAAESHVDRSIAGPDEFIHTNVVGTFHLLEAARGVWGNALAGKRFVQVSTDEVYGSLGSSGVFIESSPYAPNSPYAASKAAGDLLARSYRQTYGLPVVITHGANSYGPHQFPEKLIPAVIQKLIARRPVPVYGDGLNVRDWMHVADHAEALWRVLTVERADDVYNLGGGNEWANLTLVERICDLFDQLSPASDGESRRLIAFVPDRPGHDRRYATDSRRARAGLGWAPARSFDEGLRETVSWYLQHQDWVRRVTRKGARSELDVSLPCPVGAGEVG